MRNLPRRSGNQHVHKGPEPEAKLHLEVQRRNLQRAPAITGLRTQPISCAVLTKMAEEGAKMPIVQY
jgi:hypothetical protein